MHTNRPAYARWLLPGAVVVAALAALACSGGPEAHSEGEAPQADIVLLPEDVFVVGVERVAAGPRIAGTIEAAEAAALRAEIPGSVTTVEVDVGEPVVADQILARIDNAGVGSSYASARTSVATAEAQVAQAERELARAKRLFEAGALAPRDVEVAERQLEAARTQLDAAGAQRAVAGDQAASATVRSPIAGVVAERSVSVGDVVAPGAPLFTVIEPTSLRFEGSVPASAAGQVHLGDMVEFTVTGHKVGFIGSVQRIAPAVDPSTRQIPVIVAIESTSETLIAGLFAVGRIATSRGDGIVVPLDAVRKVGEGHAVLRVRDGVIEEVPIVIGVLDEAGEQIVVESGLAVGDVVLVGGAREATPGAHAELREPEAPSSAG